MGANGGEAAPPSEREMHAAAVRAEEFGKVGELLHRRRRRRPKEGKPSSPRTVHLGWLTHSLARSCFSSE